MGQSVERGSASKVLGISFPWADLSLSFNSCTWWCVQLTPKGPTHPFTKWLMHLELSYLLFFPLYLTRSAFHLCLWISCSEVQVLQWIVLSLNLWHVVYSCIRELLEVSLAISMSRSSMVGINWPQNALVTLVLRHVEISFPTCLS